MDITIQEQILLMPPDAQSFYRLKYQYMKILDIDMKFFYINDLLKQYDLNHLYNGLYKPNDQIIKKVIGEINNNCKMYSYSYNDIPLDTNIYISYASDTSLMIYLMSKKSGDYIPGKDINFRYTYTNQSITNIMTRIPIKLFLLMNLFSDKPINVDLVKDL